MCLTKCDLILCLILILTLFTTSSLGALTPLVKQGRIKEAREAAIVAPEHFLNVTSYAGHLTVDERYNSNLFFWYFPVIDQPVESTAWIIWLQGGPGSSSLVGLFDEMGPFEYSEKENKLVARKWMWCKNYSMVFIDNPVGVGFSYTDSDKGFATSMEQYTSHLYTALQQFLTIFPELRKAPLFLAGESYAGHFVPAFGLEVLNRKPSGNESVNLKGIMLGNPVLERENIMNASAVFFQWGLVDRQGVLAVKKFQDQYLDAIRKDDAEAAQQSRNILLDKLEDMSFQSQMFNVLEDKLVFNGFEMFLHSQEISDAVHAGGVRYSMKNITVAKKLTPEFLSHMRPVMETLLNNFRVMVYCGQLDLIAPCQQNAAAVRSHWYWSGRNQFLKAARTPWWYNNTVAGYVKSGGNFTEVLVRRAGHLVPIDQPASTFELVSNFIRDLDFPLPSHYRPDQSYTPEYVVEPPSNNSSTKTVMVVSLIGNAVLIIAVVVGVVILRIRAKRQNEFWMYNTVSDNFDNDDPILSIT